MRPERRLSAGLTVVTVAAALTGCGGGAGGSSPKSGGTGAVGNTITIKDFTFKPTPLKVKSGQKVTVTNQDRAVHTITAGDKSFDSKSLSKGKTYSFTAGKPGSYSYVCDIHQYMTGIVQVS